MGGGWPGTTNGRMVGLEQQQQLVVLVLVVVVVGRGGGYHC